MSIGARANAFRAPPALTVWTIGRRQQPWTACSRTPALCDRQHPGAGLDGPGASTREGRGGGVNRNAATHAYKSTHTHLDRCWLGQFLAAAAVVVNEPRQPATCAHACVHPAQPCTHTAPTHTVEARTAGRGCRRAASAPRQHGRRRPCNAGRRVLRARIPVLAARSPPVRGACILKHTARTRLAVRRAAMVATATPGRRHPRTFWSRAAA